MLQKETEVLVSKQTSTKLYDTIFKQTLSPFDKTDPTSEQI